MVVSFKTTISTVSGNQIQGCKVPVQISLILLFFISWKPPKFFFHIWLFERGYPYHFFEPISERPTSKSFRVKSVRTDVIDTDHTWRAVVRGECYITGIHYLSSMQMIPSCD